MKYLLFLLTVAFYSCTQKDTKTTDVLNQESAAIHTDSLAGKPSVIDTSAAPAPVPSDPDTKIVKLGHPEFTFGDIGHLSFKDLDSKKTQEYEWVGDFPAIEEIINKCSNREGCPALKDQTYSATMNYRLMDIEDWDGEKMRPTGKKEKRWVIVAIEKIKH